MDRMEEIPSHSSHSWLENVTDMDSSIKTKIFKLLEVYIKRWIGVSSISMIPAKLSKLATFYDWFSQRLSNTQISKGFLFLFFSNQIAILPNCYSICTIYCKKQNWLRILWSFLKSGCKKKKNNIIKPNFL